MKLNEDIWAIVTPDGKVCGDGECSCLCLSRESAERQIEYMGDFLRQLNSVDELKIVKCRLVSQEEA